MHRIHYGGDLYLDENFVIYYFGQQVGTAKLSQNGLYYSFYGKVNLEKNMLWRIFAVAEHGDTDLGICYYEAPFYVFDKRIASKHIKGNLLYFKAISSDESGRSKFALSEYKPFEPLEHICESTYCTKDYSGLIINRNH